jgi:Flp pilus assembly pilin Flp
MEDAMKPSRMHPDDRGAVAIEYAILGAIVGLGIVATLIQTARNLNVRYDSMSYSISQATASTAGPKTVLKVVQGTPYTDGGRPVNQKTIFYTDGTNDLVRTPPDDNKWFTSGVLSYDASGNLVKNVYTNAAGDAYTQDISYLSPNVSMVSWTGTGSCNCIYRSALSYDAQADGSTNVIYKNNFVSAAASGGPVDPSMYSQQTVVYNSSSSFWNYVGDITTSMSGVTTNNGQNVSRYQ